MVLVPLSDEGYDPAFDQGYSIIPAVELAAEQINRRTDILPGFDLVLNIKDAGCDNPSKTALETVGILRELIAVISAPVGIIGPACSEDSIFIANFFDNTGFEGNIRLPVFYSGTMPYLSKNAAAFPDIYGMISSTDILTDTLMRIAEEENWNWKNIAVLYDQTRQHFTDTYTAFVNQFNDSKGIGYTRQIADSQIPLREIINRNIRIVVVFSDKKPAHQLACLAGQSTVNFVFPMRQFIFIERSLEDFLGDESAEPSFTVVEQSESKKYFCDRETVMRGLNGSVLLNQALDSVDPDVVIVSNYTAGQVKEQYKERLSECGRTMEPAVTLKESRFAYPYYDAMWAFAHSLNSVLFTPSSTYEVLHDAIQNISFQGVSSWIEFRTSGDQHVSNPVRISQVDQSNAMTITLYNKNNLTYPADVFISDEFIAVNVLLHSFLITIGFMSAFFLFVFIAVVQVTSVIYRNHPYVKASSPMLNHFIFLGCHLFMVAVISATIQRIKPEASGLILCNLDPFCSLLAYCFIISTVLAKSWRTYRIFSDPFKRKRFLKDSSLTLFIIGCALVNILLFVPFFVLSPFKSIVSFTFDKSQWPPVRKQTTVCGDSESFWYIIFPLTFQLLLTIATIFLATLNRRIVKRPNFRTTKQIFVFVYLLVLTWAIGGSFLVIFFRPYFYINGVYSLYISLLVLTVFLSLSFLQLSTVKLCLD